MYFSDLKKLDKQYISNTYARAEVDIQSGSGAVCRDLSGREFTDFGSGIGVNSLGFINAAWVDAVKAQLNNISHTSNLYYTQPAVNLAKALCERTGMKRVFFSNSGAEANEGAIKAARKYSSDKYSHERHEIITLVNSFHGRTIATLAATGQESMHKNFGPFPSGFVYAEANNLADLQSKVNGKTCAIMLEFVQGEGGVIPLDDSFVKGIAAICAEKDILLVADEVQTGVGRTGRFLCGEYFGIKPDIITLAKGLGGGLPIGAVLFGEKTMDTLGGGDHGSTYGGNPVCCSGALAVIESVDGKFLDDVCAKGDYFREKLLAIPGVAGISGKGMMLGVALEDGLTSADTARRCALAGLIVLTAKEKVRLLPPLTIAYAEIDCGLAILTDALANAISDRNREEAKS